ncbi:TldD/PmbA family protein [Asticcacaulis excentricus]|uniref:TldE protein n=1 Tax=Asticcacaulis excentricus TaxID=78587 RepID=A0A3G9GB65_9CAUL|nr:TldD/PmbA family protein [Asticcacaulis excentricus]BBF82524.1 TldE protein [Asticcacaulis excentricus]
MLHTQTDTPARTDSTALLAHVIGLAQAQGADAAEAVYSQSRSLTVGVRKGAVETVESDEATDLGLRVFIGQKQAVVSVSEFSERTLARLVERCVAMARLAPDDAYAGLADPARLWRGDGVELDIFDPTELSADALRERALACEAAGLIDPRLQSDAASAGQSFTRWQLLTSDGFAGHHRTSLSFQSARLIATDETGGMERDGEGRSTRYLSDLPTPEATGRMAAERALKALGARKIDSRTAPVLFEPRTAKSLIGLFLGAISGPSVARGSSYLKDRLGQRLFAPGVHIIDNPFRPRGLGSCLYDDEGVAVRERALIDDGILTTWLLNSAAGRQLGMASTGHASRSLAHPAGVSAHNVTLSPGSRSPADLMAAAGSGVLITSMFGPSVNSDTGDWSAGASGFVFENGELTHPVNEITVAGNLIDIFARLEPASDLEIKGTLDTPSILVDGLSIGGK